ncbi:hypothetical protein KP509_04G026300, partial [Ceratopteris richardii]
MAGVWVFKNGVAKLVQNPMVEIVERRKQLVWRQKALVYLPTNEVVSSYSELEEKLRGLGWERYPYNRDPDKLQFHRGISSKLLISLPRDYAKFKTMHMFDIVLKNRDFFEVRD